LIKYFIAGFFAVTPFVASACEAEAHLRADALRTLYADQDITRYVCVDNEKCSFEDFSRQLETKQISLGPESTTSLAIQVEPLRKGRQYFSAVYLLDQCKYHMVFAPDTTLSGVKFLKQIKNNFYVLRAIERNSAESWKEYDFAYDSPVRQYNLMKTRCFRMGENKTLNVKCD
jgi:hypothetical protein